MTDKATASVVLLVKETFATLQSSHVECSYEWVTSRPVQGIKATVRHRPPVKDYSHYRVTSTDMECILDVVDDHGSMALELSVAKSSADKSLTSGFASFEYDLSGRSFVNSDGTTVFLCSISGTKSCTSVKYELVFPRERTGSRLLKRTEFFRQARGYPKTRWVPCTLEGRQYQLRHEETLPPRTPLDPLLITVQRSWRPYVRFLVYALPWATGGWLINVVVVNWTTITQAIAAFLQRK